MIIIAEKDKELATCQGEMKALRSTEALKDKAIEEVLLLNAVTNSPLYTYHPPKTVLEFKMKNSLSKIKHMA